MERYDCSGMELLTDRMNVDTTHIQLTAEDQPLISSWFDVVLCCQLVLVLSLWQVWNQLLHTLMSWHNFLSSYSVSHFAAQKLLIKHTTFQLGNNELIYCVLSDPNPNPPGWVGGYRCGCAAPGAVHWAHPQCPLCWTRRGSLHCKLTLHKGSSLTNHIPSIISLFTVLDNTQLPCERVHPIHNFHVREFIPYTTSMWESSSHTPYIPQTFLVRVIGFLLPRVGLISVNTSYISSIPEEVRLQLALYPGSRWAGKERAWYPLFAHALNFPEILGNWKLLCYICKTVTT